MPSAFAMLGCEVVLRPVPGLITSDPPVSGFGRLLRVIGLFVLKMSVYDKIDPAHLYPLTSRWEVALRTRCEQMGWLNFSSASSTSGPNRSRTLWRRSCLIGHAISWLLRSGFRMMVLPGGDAAALTMRGSDL